MTRFLIILLAALSIGCFYAASAQAVSDVRAKEIANWWSAKWCPHHTAGVCLRRRASASRYWVGARPLGHNLVIEGWESSFFDPTRDWRKARWYYRRCGYLTSDGKRIVNTRWC